MAAERPDKKEKKEKKEKRTSEEAGVKKDKKEKKEKKEKKDKLAAAVEDKIQQDAAAKPSKKDKKAAAAAEDDSDSDMEDGDKAAELPLERTVVSFAIPVADEKGMKKVYKTIRKSAKNGTLKRGVKEVVKTLRKSPAAGPSSTSFPGIVVIAGDISPADVISHIPVLCEDHNVPFIFVTSRAELGAAAKTKRPTSVVMIMQKQDGKNAKSKKDDEEKDDGEDFGEAYASLAKYVQKEYQKQSFWAKGDSKALL
ncbi:Ribosomal protein L7Ae/L30e/S12e/Gadd45 [Akanthomyces lecanii RCEF 1005]|uniref:Ribosomal protein L7Ae/L30e/S12e/Gadd45 n=1 Tax=Akanthomyces lecanii RCEF 1005 TaxID=1081108 RepID=A0A168BIC3_CORDF|nr:Ribosomal protein L7Ae/L30e/S12e/Gadd45 [Akanthomyces lecanii RCEF 1005]